MTSETVEAANNEHEIAGPRISFLNFGMKLVVCREKQIYTHLPSQAAIPRDHVGWQPYFLSIYRKAHSQSVGKNLAFHLQMGELWLSLWPLPWCWHRDPQAIPFQSLGPDSRTPPE